jgi:uncharacterized protein YndB with AHSA1/START domain
MAPITGSVEISRRPEDVFAYVTDPSHLPDWQESVVSVRGEAPYTVGSTIVVTRRVGRMEREMTSKLGELTRGDVKGTVEPLGDGERSKVTIALDLEGHGIGKLLLPLVVRRQVRAEMPRNMQKLKEQLELGP